MDKARGGKQHGEPMPELLQFCVSGLTVGAVYALVALGFTIIYNASDVVNFAQGEFVMIGGMTTVFVAAAGVPLPLAALIAIAVAMGIGLLLHRLAIEPARGASADNGAASLDHIERPIPRSRCAGYRAER